MLAALVTAGLAGCADEADERPATTTAFTTVASTGVATSAAATSAGATDSDGGDTGGGSSGTTTSASGTTTTTTTSASTGTATTADPTTGTGTTGTACTPGDGFACVCPDGSAGLSVCTPDGAGFGPCECASDTDGTTGETTSGTGGEPASEVCFLGEDGSGTTCIPVRALDAAMFGYPAAPADPNYRAPLGFLDLQGQAGTLKLAPNFALDEFADPAVIRDAVLQPHAVQRLQAIRDAVGPVVVEVAFRTPTADAAAGAPAGSRHPYGDGFELRAPNTTLSALAQACTANAGTATTTATTVRCDFRSVPVDPAMFGEP